MSLENLPTQIPVKELENCSTEYHAEKMATYTALYEGGEKFNARKRKFLPKRPLEQTQAAADGKHYEMRLQNAFYTNYSGGLIDWFSAKIVENMPRIVPGDNVRDRDFWLNLNKDADGLGNPLATLCRWSAREQIVNNRAYFLIDFLEEGDKDSAKITFMGAESVDDWDKDKKGMLEWARRHTVEPIRNPEQPWNAPEKEAHWWTFFDDQQIVVYRAERKIGAMTWDAGVMATKQDQFSVEHEFGMPVFDVRADHSIWVMDRIHEPLVKLFQREAALNFYLDALSYQMIKLRVGNPGNWEKIPVTPLGAIVLERGDDIGFFGPNGSGFDPSFKAVDECKKSFYESLQIMAKEAAAIDQAGRLSGEAVDAMQRPMEVLLGSFAWPMKDALERAVQKLKEFRREPDADIRIEGLGQVTVDEQEVRQVALREDAAQSQQAPSKPEEAEEE